MNSSIEKPKGTGRQLEMFPRFLENVPDYEKKLLAWDYVNLSDDDRKAFINKIFITDDRRYPSPVGASLALNNKAKFPLTEPRITSGVVAVRQTEDLREYCKDILDKFGEVLPSKEQKKAA